MTETRDRIGPSDPLDGLREHLTDGSRTILEIALLSHDGDVVAALDEIVESHVYLCKAAAAGATITIQWPGGDSEPVGMF